MDAKLFAEGYDRTVATEEIQALPHSRYITDAQDWSHRFGVLLHEELSGERRTALQEAQRDVYMLWAGRDLPRLSSSLANAPLAERLNAGNELNFHALNRHMINMWIPLVNGRWGSNADRHSDITTAQDYLALEGLLHYALRHKVLKRQGGHVFYENDDNASMTNTHVGIIQEIDAAIVLLDIVRRHPQLTLVPAPLQFERSRLKSRNVDFVVVDVEEDQAVGVQVKTKVTPSAYHQADQRRVVFVDGMVDLGNVRAIRAHKGKSAERVVPWPGIIAAKRVDAIRTHGKRSAHFSKYAPQIIRQKMIARELVGTTRVDYADISQKLGERILRKLYEPTEVARVS